MIFVCFLIFAYSRYSYWIQRQVSKIICMISITTNITWKILAKINHDMGEYMAIFAILYSQSSSNPQNSGHCLSVNRTTFIFNINPSALGPILTTIALQIYLNFVSNFCVKAHKCLNKEIKKCALQRNFDVAMSEALSWWLLLEIPPP